MRKKKPVLNTPTGLALDLETRMVTIAEISPDRTSYSIYQVPLGEKRAANIINSDIRATLCGGNAHTEQLRTVEAGDDDETILNAVLQAANDGRAYSFSRTADNRVVCTQVDQPAVTEIASYIGSWLDDQRPPHVSVPTPSLIVETRTRAIARAWSMSTQYGEHSPGGTVAFIVLSKRDYGFALWSEQTGLVYETEEPFEPGTTVDDMCDHVRTVFSKVIDESTIHALQLPPVTKAIVSAPDDLIETLIQVLREAEELHSLSIEQVSLNLGDNEPTTLDQPTALAIGSIVPGYLVPVCDLMDSPSDRLSRLKQHTHLEEQAAKSTQVMRATVALLLPIVAAAAFLITCMADQSVEGMRLQARINEENIRAEQLKKENAEYDSAKANFQIFHHVLNTIVDLRKRQPATHQLLVDLNQRWPADATWYVSDINVKAGAIEIKGKTKNEQAVTSFAKSLEFSNGLFTNILTKANAQGATSNNPASGGQLATSNVIEFTINATYTPLASPGKAVPAQNASAADAQSQPRLPTAIPLNTPALPVVQPPAGPAHPAQPNQPPAVSGNQPTIGANQ